MGSMQLMLVEGEEGEEGGGGHSCGLFQELQWELHADTLRGVVYATDRDNSDPDHRLWEVEVRMMSLLLSLMVMGYVCMFA